LQLLTKRPILVPFAILRFLIEVLEKPNRTLRESDEPVKQPAGRWIKANPLPSWRYEFGGALLGEEIYVVGGLILPTVYTVTRRVETYNVVTNSWRRTANLPVIIHHPGVTVADNRLYVIGGNGLRITPYSYVFQYNPSTNSWKRNSDMPTPRGALGIAEMNGFIYVMGGGTNKIPRNELEVYDPKNDAWTKLEPMPTEREHLAATSAGGLIFAMGGFKKNLAESLTANEAYNPSTGEWENRAPLPLPISGFSAVGIGSSVFIFGGEQGWAVSSECHEYKVSEDRWYRRMDMPTPKYAHIAVAVDGEIHIIGGNPRLGGYAFCMNHDIFIPA